MAASPLPWIRVIPGVPAFETETGEPFIPIGYNDAMSWVDLAPLYRRRDMPSVAAHLRDLRSHGVTVIRMMLECAHARHRLLERPIGVFTPNVVRFWDDMVALCEETGMRLLLTPVDTFWTWIRWRHHPYNRQNGGPLETPADLLLDREVRAAIKARLTFAVERWGGSGAVFAWDLWNEIHPAQARDSAEVFPEFIADLSAHVRSLETRLYGRSHPQTVSLFGPELRWRSHMPLREPIFRHPDLDFASIHIYQEGTIDDPSNTVDAALAMAAITADSVAETAAGRPFLDTEHGPIHRFKDKKKTLPEAFDDEYFRHMQWAHFASGGCGGGMRWPNRSPHRLTYGMRRAQRALAAFCREIDWRGFRRTVLDREALGSASDCAVFGIGDDRQAVVWLLRRDIIGRDGMIDRRVPSVARPITVPGLRDGRYRVLRFDTAEGHPLGESVADAEGGRLAFTVPNLLGDVALAIRPDG
ncbi:hypothetical protein [Chthonobacter rhizosphaerae]|uniref:hypothetical protein n=1 Tax=Chthonobacter rhizosphaerae TaxID=2735553 RepID=UPI0015EE6B6C|nr:hypothetical protein [Chthonobacter rhizosphaerae]